MRQPLHEMRVSVPLLLASALMFSSAPSTFVEAASSRVASASGAYASIERYPLHSHRTQENQDAVRAKLRRLSFEKISNEDENPPPPRQLKIHTFALVVSPTPDGVPLLEEKFYGVVEHTIQSYVKKQTKDLEYVYLADIAEVSRSDESATHSSTRNWMEGVVSTTIVFSGGVASFTESTSQHPISQINAWVQEALEKDLLAVFAGNFSAQYGAITKASYVSMSAAPSMEPTSAPVDGPVFDEVNSASTVADDKGRIRYGVIVAVALGASFFVLAIAMLVKKRHQNSSFPADTLEKDAVVFVDEAATDVDDAETDNGDATSDITEIESEVAHYRHRGAIAALGRGGSGRTTDSMAGTSVGGLSAPEEMADGVSVTSEWTLSTVEESLFASDRQRINNSWVVAEIFDRDRQVNISKDMLHTVWSGRQPAPAATPAAPRSTRGDFSSRRTEQGYSPAFVFEQANGGGSEGEEVFLMPPSRVTANVEPDTATL